ncbi:MAG: hypothetical protein GJ680_18395 [Alteromonadaceae bacterium]|nr:hypothetical protein [Alteromonadaceae bacterium]
MFSIISFTEHMAGGMVLGPMKRAGIDYFMITHGLNITQLIFCTLMLLSVYHRRKIMQRCRAWFGWDITLEVTPVDRIHNFINFFLWTITFILTVWTIYVMYGLADLTQLEYIKAQADLKATVFTYLKIYLAAEIMRYISIFLFLPVRDISTPSGGGRTDTSVEHIPTSSPVHARTESSNTYSRTRIDE